MGAQPEGEDEKMSSCETAFAAGECHGEHLGKFSSCLDEALYLMALEDVNSGCGDGDWEGYAAPVTVEAPEETTLDPDGAELVQVVVPAGFYIVWTATSGAVTVTSYETVEDADAAFGDWENRYHAWEDQD